MNVFTLKECVQTYKKEVINSGLQRDLQDYVTTIAQSAGNSEILRNIGTKIEKTLKRFQDDGVAAEIEKLLPTQIQSSIFVLSELTRIEALNNDPQLQIQQYHQQITNIINELNTKCQNTTKAINKIEEFIQPYVASTSTRESESGMGMISLIFKDSDTTKKLSSFSKEIDGWRKVLPIYSNLITNKSPHDIEIVNVQNGSIDVILNLDVDVAINLAELFGMAVKGFAAFLAYKTANRKIEAAIKGNNRYQEIENEKQGLLLENIRDSVKRLANEQVKKEGESEKKIEAMDKKIDMITSAVANHVIKGNEIKLVSYDKSFVQDEVELVNREERTKESLVEASRDYKLLDSETKQKLLTQYKEIKE